MLIKTMRDTSCYGRFNGKSRIFIKEKSEKVELFQITRFQKYFLMHIRPLIGKNHTIEGA